ncbi:hypothetical protein D7X55_35690, partial [Corallococcus sp. AB049A]
MQPVPVVVKQSDVVPWKNSTRVRVRPAPALAEAMRGVLPVGNVAPEAGLRTLTVGGPATVMATDAEPLSPRLSTASALTVWLPLPRLLVAVQVTGLETGAFTVQSTVVPARNVTLASVRPEVGVAVAPRLSVAGAVKFCPAEGAVMATAGAVGGAPE